MLRGENEYLRKLPVLDFLNSVEMMFSIEQLVSVEDVTSVRFARYGEKINILESCRSWAFRAVLRRMSVVRSWLVLMMRLRSLRSLREENKGSWRLPVLGFLNLVNWLKSNEQDAITIKHFVRENFPLRMSSGREFSWGGIIGEGVILRGFP